MGRFSPNPTTLGLAGETTVASATTTDIGGAATDKVAISGTTTITSLGSVANVFRLIRFTGALTLTHNATSLILPGGLNITTAAGDTAIAVSDSSGNWRIYEYTRANGSGLGAALSTIASATTTDLGSVLSKSITISGTTTITGLGSSAPTGDVKFVQFSGALTLTHNATSLIIPGGANILTVAGDTMTVRHEGSGNWRVMHFARFGTVPGEEIHGIALSDETTAITTGTNKATFSLPYAFKVRAVYATLNTVSSSGIPTVDINEGGTTILSTKLTIDASEKTSATAATAAVISDPDIAANAEIGFDIDVAGTGAKGLKVFILGTRA